MDTDGRPMVGGGATSSTGTYQGVCSGTITVVFKWQGEVEDIPKAVLIEESCTANAYNTGSPGVTTGDVANGRLGDDVLTTTDHSNPPPYFQQKKVGYNTNGSIIKHYSIIEEPGDTITLTITPSANCVTPGGGTASVRYKASATPIDIAFTGGIGSNGEKRFLIGQRVQAELTEIGLEVEEREWSAYGGYYYGGFSKTATTGHMINYDSGNLDDEVFLGWFSSGTTVTMSVSGELAVPSGSKPAAGLEFSTERTFALDKPVFTAVDGPSIADLALHSDSLGCGLIDDAFEIIWPQPAGSQWYGFGVRATSTVPSGYSQGLWHWVQLIQLGQSRVVSGVTQYLTMGGQTDGADTIEPYSSVYPDYTDDHWVTHASEERSIHDTPGSTFSLSASSYHYENDFESFVMFLPPGTGSQYVPRYKIQWWMSGDFIKSGSVFVASGNLEEDLTITASDPPFPYWERIISGASYP